MIITSMNRPPETTVSEQTITVSREASLCKQRVETVIHIRVGWISIRLLFGNIRIINYFTNKDWQKYSLTGALSKIF